MCDLIAAEAKYHLPCLTVFKRNAEKAKLETKENDQAMIWLCDELEYAADKGYVIKLNDAWNRYMVLAERAEIEIPRSIISRGGFRGGPRGPRPPLLLNKFVFNPLDDWNTWFYPDIVFKEHNLCLRNSKKRSSKCWKSHLWLSQFQNCATVPISVTGPLFLNILDPPLIKLRSTFKDKLLLAYEKPDTDDLLTMPTSSHTKIFSFLWFM